MDALMCYGSDSESSDGESSPVPQVEQPVKRRGGISSASGAIPQRQAMPSLHSAAEASGFSADNLRLFRLRHRNEARQAARAARQELAEAGVIEVPGITPGGTSSGTDSMGLPNLQRVRGLSHDTVADIISGKGRDASLEIAGFDVSKAQSTESMPAPAPILPLYSNDMEGEIDKLKHKYAYTSKLGLERNQITKLAFMALTKGRERSETEMRKKQARVGRQGANL
ncbi:hypothetical protein KIPB_011990 [Kipferlia bialata]|uniref:Uncharacterized protein n=1 Tax=Kipferlia bialata TaxID=797122 RepID=A0A391NT63_9EUKA|nr:hypothetical protein KIPB_011990 [Kipferlia bialata]|eukprot:g11990.t1